MKFKIGQYWVGKGICEEENRSIYAQNNRTVLYKITKLTDQHVDVEWWDCEDHGQEYPIEDAPPLAIYQLLEMFKVGKYKRINKTQAECLKRLWTDKK